DMPISSMRNVQIHTFLKIIVCFTVISATLKVVIIGQWDDGTPMDSIDELSCDGMQFIAYNQEIETARGKNF
ncbi:hypothetical protein PMAYCL1PPCAC_33106, partial [Pristionchus mayeri]